MNAARLVAVAALGLVVLLSSGISAEVAKPRYRKPAPGFTLVDTRQAPLTLSDFKGKVVVLNFWATWSAGSKVEMPWFAEFENRYRTNGLAVVGVSMDDEGWAIVTPYLEAHPIGYPVVLGGHDIAERFGIISLPVTLLIDRNGKIAARHYGVVEKANLENEIRKLLKERAKTPKEKK